MRARAIRWKHEAKKGTVVLITNYGVLRIGKSVPRLVAAATLILSVSGLILPAGAAQTRTNSFAPLDADAVCAFANSVVPPAMRAGQIPGADLVVVCGDKVICEKAFGVSNLKTEAPVSPNQTLFRVASISKILTAAAVLELACANRLDLRRNVNAYLTRFQIAPAFGEPVTMADLLTHSSGFDDCQFAYAAHTEAARLSLEAYLARYQPLRVRPPGLFSVYDNYGYALAGYLVQKISGVSFADFVQARILDPLDMMHSSFRPDAALRENLATGYWLDGEVPRPFQPDYVNITPAAGLCTTASDMADFLIALLADQRPNGAKMFPANVLRRLETRQFAAGPQVTGRCDGFDRILLAGRTALRQTGQWPGFDSTLLLFPKAHCGVFLTYNLYDNLRLAQNLTRLFAERFIPPDADSGAKAPGPNSLTPLLGSYLSARIAHDAPELGFPREIDVTESKAGNLVIDGEPYRAIGQQVFEEIELDRFAGAAAGQRVMFLPAGGDLHLITQNGAYRRVDWADSTHGRLFLLRAASWVFLSALVLWPFMAFWRSIPRNASRTTDHFSHHSAKFSLGAQVSALAASGLALWFETSYAIARREIPPFATLYGFPAPLEHLLWVLPALMLLIVALVAFCVVAWWRRTWHPALRWHYTLVVAALGVFLYAFCSLHLLAAEFATGRLL